MDFPGWSLLTTLTDQITGEALWFGLAWAFTQLRKRNFSRLVRFRHARRLALRSSILSEEERITVALEYSFEEWKRERAKKSPSRKAA